MSLFGFIDTLNTIKSDVRDIHFSLEVASANSGNTGNILGVLMGISEDIRKLQKEMNAVKEALSAPDQSTSLECQEVDDKAVKELTPSEDRPKKRLMRGHMKAIFDYLKTEQRPVHLDKVVRELPLSTYSKYGKRGAIANSLSHLYTSGYIDRLAPSIYKIKEV